ANIAEGLRLWLPQRLHVAEPLIQYALVHIAQGGDLGIGNTRKAFDVIVATTAHTANRHPHAIIRAENLPAQRECGRACSDCLSCRLEEVTPVNCHIRFLCPRLKFALPSIPGYRQADCA